MVEFAGYEMPIQYLDGISKSHFHTRQKASLFDVSHMGQLKIVGSDRVKFVERITVADISAIPTGTGALSLITNERGGIIDDTIVTNFGDSVGMVVNGGCKDKDKAHFDAQLELFKEKGRDVNIVWSTNSLVALQGPLSVKVLQKLTDFDVNSLHFFGCASFLVDGVICQVQRSGYTGEDGFEISIPYEQTQRVVVAILNQEDVLPAGLGSRDTLRLEAGLCLYGNDLDETITPKQASLTWTISERRKKSGGFIGDKAILAELDVKLTDLSRRRVGFVGNTKTPARHGAIIYSGDEEIGVVSSGNVSPTLGIPIGMAYVKGKYGKIGSILHADVRGKRVEITVAKLPFIELGYHK